MRPTAAERAGGDGLKFVIGIAFEPSTREREREREDLFLHPSSVVRGPGIHNACTHQRGMGHGKAHK